MFMEFDCVEKVSSFSGTTNYLPSAINFLRCIKILLFAQRAKIYHENEFASEKHGETHFTMN